MVFLTEKMSYPHSKITTYQILNPYSVTYDHLNYIENIKFTPKEIDILACIISGKTNDEIANLFFLSPRTVESHIRGISIKIELKADESPEKSRSRHLIIDFLEKSPKYNLLKNHYLFLLTQDKFRKTLQQTIVNSHSHAKISCVIVSLNGPSELLAKELKKHLQWAGITSSYEKFKFESEALNYFYVLSSHEAHLLQKKIIFLHQLSDDIPLETLKSSLDCLSDHIKENFVHILEMNESTSLEKTLISEQPISYFQNYYGMFFSLLEKISANQKFSSLSADFINFIDTLESHSQTPVNNTLPEQTFLMKFKSYKWFLSTLALIFSLLLIVLRGFIVKNRPSEEYEQGRTNWFLNKHPYSWPSITPKNVYEMSQSHTVKEGFIQIHSSDVQTFLELLKLRPDKVIIRGVFFLDALTIGRLKDCLRCFPDIQGWGVKIKGLDDPKAMTEFLSLPELKKLKTLILWSNNIGAQGLKALTLSPQLFNLSRLDLGRNHIRDEGAKFLAHSPYLKNLVALNLWENDITDVGVKMLVQSPNLRAITYLNLGANNLTDEGAIFLANSSYLSNLERLNVGANNIKDLGAQVLSTSIYLDNLKDLNLYGNKISTNQAQALESWALQKGARLNIYAHQP